VVIPLALAEAERRIMCTLVIHRRPKAAWPLILAANRDELDNRPWRTPARHWPDRPEVVAGQDVLAGGSWLGINDDGVIAAVLNRPGTLGPEAGKRSRGELVLERSIMPKPRLLPEPCRKSILPAIGRSIL